jgi:hypothetical protein
MTDTMQDEYYDDATEAFPSVDDLAPLASKQNPKTEGRLVAVWAKENGTAKGENGPYGYTETLTLVLDDGPEGDQFTDLIGPAPVELELRHSTQGIHTRLKPRVEGMTKPVKADDGTVLRPSVPMRFRPMIGRINTQPSTKYKKGSPAFSISAPTEADREIVQRYADQIREINKRLEANEAKVTNAEAFES